MYPPEEATGRGRGSGARGECLIIDLSAHGTFLAQPAQLNRGQARRGMPVGEAFPGARMRQASPLGARAPSGKPDSRSELSRSHDDVTANVTRRGPVNARTVFSIHHGRVDNNCTWPWTCQPPCPCPSPNALPYTTHRSRTRLYLLSHPTSGRAIILTARSIPSIQRKPNGHHCYRYYKGFVERKWTILQRPQAQI